jgi:signal transduction histidine kinase
MTSRLAKDWPQDESAGAAVSPDTSREGETIRRLGHDLRSPLTSLSGAAELLRSGRLGTLTAQQDRCVGVLQRSVESMLRMLEEATAPFHPPGKQGSSTAGGSSRPGEGEAGK